jgi:hypothetical protein
MRNAYKIVIGNSEGKRELVRLDVAITMDFKDVGCRVNTRPAFRGTVPKIYVKSRAPHFA